MNLASTRRNWPSGRGFERWYGFLGAETSQWYPGARLRQPSGGSSRRRPRRVPLRRGHHRQGDRVHQGRQGGRAGQAVLPVLRARCVSRAAPCSAGVDRPVQGPASTWGMRRCASRRWPARSRWASSLPTRSCRRSTRSARPRRAAARTASRSRRWTSPGRGTRCRMTEKRLFSRMAEVYAGFLSHADHQIGRLLDYLEDDRAAGEHAGRRGLGQRCERRGRSERVGQRDEVHERHPGRHRGQPGDAGRPGRPEDLQPLSERLGDGVQHAVQDVEALRVRGRHQRPVHHLVAGRHRRRAARSATSTITRSTWCPRSSTPGRRAAGNDQGPHRRASSTA